MFWGNKKVISNEEFDKLVKKVSLIEAQSDRNEQLIRQLRGFVNSKIYPETPQTAEKVIKEEQKPQEKEINSMHYY